MKTVFVVRFLPRLALFISALLPPVWEVRAAQVYSNSFNGPVGTSYPEWSSSTITYTSTASPPGAGTLPSPAVTNTVSPNSAQRFLGLFGGPPIGVPGDPGYNHTRVDQTISLSLSNLPAHSSLQVSFDLYTLRSWDGNSPAYGRDRFILSVAGGQTLLDTTFSNNPKTNTGGSYQNYPRPPSAKPPQSQRGCGPSILIRTHDAFLLHLQQSFAQGYSGLNVRSCRLASRSTSTRRRHACCPSNRTAESARQQRIVRHRLHPRLALRHRPAQQRLHRRIVPQSAARSLVEDFKMPGMAAVDALEIPRARDAFREVPTLTPTFGHPLPSDGRGHTRTAAPPAGGAIPHGSSHHRESAVPRSAEGVFPNLVFVSIRKTYPMQACKIMHGLWGMGQMMFT